MRRVAVIGAGITGLSAAYELQKRRCAVRLFESAARAGGVIRSEREAGFLCEYGPSSMRLMRPEVEALLHELDLDGEIIEADPHRNKRFILRKGKPTAIATSPLGIAATPLLSIPAKLRLAIEPFIAGRKSGSDESVADFVRRRFGREALANIAGPLITGIYAGDVERLSIRYAFERIWRMEQDHGSVIRGAARVANKRKRRDGSTGFRIISLREGLESLPKALGNRLGKSLLMEVELTSIKKDAQWQLSWRKDGREGNDTFDALVLALPSFRAAALPFSRELARAMAFLRSIPYVPIAVLVTGHRREDVTHPLDGHGMLVPQNERRNLLGAIFSSTMFPGRAPRNHVTLTSIVGGARQPELVDLPRRELARSVIRDLREILGVRGQPVIEEHHSWKKAIPQFEIGHGEILGEINRLEERFPGLYLIGNYRCGVAVGDCIAAGIDTAKNIGRALGAEHRANDQ